MYVRRGSWLLVCDPNNNTFTCVLCSRDVQVQSDGIFRDTKSSSISLLTSSCVLWQVKKAKPLID